MSKKQDLKKSKKVEFNLSPEEVHELGMIADRLAVQDPEGESLGNYLRSLRQALSGREHLIAALMEKLSRNPSLVSFKAYLTFRDSIGQKNLQKTIKQAAYRFSQKGYVEERDEAPETVVLIQKEVRKPLSYVIPAEGTYGFFAALIPESRYPAPVAVTAFFEDSFEQLHVRVVETSFRSFREYLQKIADDLKDRKLGEVPLWHAARLFFEMLDLYSVRTTSPQIEEAKRLLEPYHDPGRKPYVYELMEEIPDPEVQIHSADLDALSEAVDLLYLILPRKELQPYYERIQELSNPVLVVSPEVQRERSEDWIRKAAEELCSGSRRLVYQRFFEEQALLFKLSSDDVLAMSCWIIAQHLKSGAQVSENPVLLDLIVVSMAKHWPEEFRFESGEENDLPPSQSGLILAP
ncbi:hypothetical protein [Desulforhabdus sp. TSK]|uniref:hypothetical protein n=1 Tax=Desulforhabdus sp. TSK TaxID=2925014 RepID=UPI001FC8418F|nr:hypothetical protein [Desulforhabdus sp. TSK]GKT06927.1 hypothetical protein DSTSK_02320 [Desulforhabdus sp. TSK]